jgi:hypothetical protein
MLPSVIAVSGVFLPLEAQPETVHTTEYTQNTSWVASNNKCLENKHLQVSNTERKTDKWLGGNGGTRRLSELGTAQTNTCLVWESNRVVAQHTASPFTESSIYLCI